MRDSDEAVRLIMLAHVDKSRCLSNSQNLQSLSFLGPAIIGSTKARGQVRDSHRGQGAAGVASARVCSTAGRLMPISWAGGPMLGD